MNDQKQIQALETQPQLCQRVVYSLPDMEQAQVRKDITYKTIEGQHLKFDVYYPADFQKHISLPAVLLLHGDGPAEYLKNIKDSGQYVSWGELIAATGLIAVTANHRSTEGLHNVVGIANDIDDLILYVREHSKTLHIDADTLCLWTCSSGAPFALRTALNEAPPYVRGIVCYYGFTELKALYEGLYGVREINKRFLDDDEPIPPTFTEEDFDEFSANELLLRRSSDIAPLFIARAGLDFPELNTVLDRFIAEAIAQNCEITFMNHPMGQHSFDIRDANGRSEEIIEATLEFLRTHLLQ